MRVYIGKKEGVRVCIDVYERDCVDACLLVSLSKRGEREKINGSVRERECVFVCVFVCVCVCVYWPCECACVALYVYVTERMRKR